MLPVDCVQGPAAARTGSSAALAECGGSKCTHQSESTYAKLVNMMSLARIVAYNLLPDGSL